MEATQDLRSSQTYYEILEVQPDASPQEIRDSYLKIKSAYGKDSIALYSLMNTAETQEILRRVEEAYLVLSHVERRKEYDRIHGIVEIKSGFPEGSHSYPPGKVVSIDRVPPMEDVDPKQDANRLLLPPSTDFTANRVGATPPIQSQRQFSENAWGTPPPARPAPSPAKQLSPAEIVPAQDPFQVVASQARQPAIAAQPEIMSEIENEKDWHGSFLKKVRESRSLSIEELSEITRISKTYLTAIEEENFSKLPAAVYVRGFVTQVARTLKLAPDPVTAAYLKRFNAARKD